MVTDADVIEAEQIRRRLFPARILGLGWMEELAIVGRIQAARDGANGHSARTVRELLEGLAWHDMPPATELARDLVDGVMGRARKYIESRG